MDRLHYSTSQALGIIILLIFAETAWGQCVTCRWTNEDSSFLKWESHTDDDGEVFLRVAKCSPNKCGMASMQSPWLPPNSAQRQVDLQFKVYGYSSVYLKLYLREEGSAEQPKALFAKFANYGESFPTAWSSGKVTIPKTNSRFQLSLKALTPFKDAFVAVKGFELLDGGPVGTPPSTSTTSSTTTTTRRPPIPTVASTPNTTIRTTNSIVVSTSSTTTRATNSIDFPDDDENTEFSQALEDGKFVGVEELTLGHTTVVNPNICKYN